MSISTGPTGRILEGHVLDCAKGPLLERLRDYDPLLYLKWNPDKRNGWGCWEVRRRPEKMTIVDMAELDNAVVFKLGYQEINLVNHVLDAPRLGPWILTKLRAMDTWKDKNWVDNLIYSEGKHREKLDINNQKELKYNIKQFRSLFKTYKEMVLSGTSPAEIAKYWDSQTPST